MALSSIHQLPHYSNTHAGSLFTFTQQTDHALELGLPAWQTETCYLTVKEHVDISIPQCTGASGEALH